LSPLRREPSCAGTGAVAWRLGPGRARPNVRAVLARLGRGADAAHQSRATAPLGARASTGAVRKNGQLFEARALTANTLAHPICARCAPAVDGVPPGRARGAHARRAADEYAPTEHAHAEPTNQYARADCDAAAGRHPAPTVHAAAAPDAGP